MRKPYFKRSHDAWYINTPQGAKKLGKTEQEAMAAWAAMVKDDGFTLSDLITKWLAWVKANRSKETHSNYKRYADKFVETHGKLAAASFRGHHVNEFVERIFPSTDYSDSVRWQAQKVAVVAFAWAKNQGLLDTNPLSDYRKNARCGKRQTFITFDQFKALRDACTDPAFKDLLEVLWETGARPFEVFQATARHLDARGCLRFSATAGDKVKSHASRTIWLSDRAAEILTERAGRYPECPLLRNGYNRAWTITACSRRLAVLRRATGINVTLYDFRHGFAHHHATKGTNIVTLAALMGHSSVKMLSEIYAHVGDNVDCMRAAVRA